MQITERVWGIFTFGKLLNGYVIRGDDGVTVVDTGMNDSFIKAITTTLTTMNHTWEDVKRILITHAHPDHVGSLTTIHEQYSTPIWAHEKEADVIRGKVDVGFPDPDSLGFYNRIIFRMANGNQIKLKLPVERDLQDGDAMPEVARDAYVIHLPGHSNGQMGIWLEEDRLLICGDALMHLPQGLTAPIKGVSPSWSDARESVQKIRDMQPDIICFGHGNPLMDDIQGRVQQVLNRMRA